MTEGNIVRKVFISTVPMQQTRSVKNRSRDFELGDKEYKAPISYLLDANVRPGDDVLILTAAGTREWPQKNYQEWKNEFEEILKTRQVKARFEEITEPDFDRDNFNSEQDNLDSLTFSQFFKDVADQIQDGDSIYADVTYGMKCYTIAMMIALQYVAKACKNTDVKAVIYAQYFKGEQGKTPDCADLIDVTSLLYLSSMLANVEPGQKENMDSFLKLVLE